MADDPRLAEIRAVLNEHRRRQRDRKLRAGRAYPRTYREMAIFGADLAADDDPRDGGEPGATDGGNSP